MAWYKDLKSATSKLRHSVWKLSFMPKVTGRETDPWGKTPCQGQCRRGLVARSQLLEVEVHFIQGLDEDDVEPTSSIDESLREQGALDYWLNDEGVGPKIWDIDPVVGPREHDWLLRPTQGLRRLGVDELNFSLVLAILSLARAGLQATKDHVDQPLGLLEGAVGIACHRGRR
jgi:hypothetical protein